MEDTAQAQSTGITANTKALITVLLLIFVFPVGVFVMWVWTRWALWLKVVVSIPAIIAIAILIGLASLGRSMNKKNGSIAPRLPRTRTTQQVAPPRPATASSPGIAR